MIETQTPEGAELSEAEAIRKALTAPELTDFTAPAAILEVKYEADSSTWSISITQNGDEKVNVIKVEDKPSEKVNELDVKPPQPIVMAGDNVITVYQSSYCWNSESQGVCADYAGPVDIMKDKTIEQVKAGEKITVSFDTSPPSEIHINRFGDGNSTEEQVAVDSFEAPAETGRYIYGIDASWPNNVKSVGGSSSYVIGFELK